MNRHETTSAPRKIEIGGDCVSCREGGRSPGLSYSDNALVCTASMPQAAQVSLICSSPFATSISRKRMSFWQEGQIQIGGGDDGSGWRGRGMTAAVPADGDRVRLAVTA
jgi:hypothetical protein